MKGVFLTELQKSSNCSLPLKLIRHFNCFAIVTHECLSNLSVSMQELNKKKRECFIENVL